MTALVVYESMFGNTQRIAEQIAEGLRSYTETEVFEVGAAPKRISRTVDLIVVGGPTHAWSMSRKRTREDTAGKTDGELVSKGIGIREWIESQQQPVPAATFDTRFAKPRVLTGSAARGAMKRLRRRGFPIVAKAQSFFVSGTKGPLLDGEQERARAWGQMLAAAMGGGVRRRTA